MGGIFAPPAEDVDWLLLVAASIANGFAEELVIRTYLLSRLEALLKSTTLAVLITTAMFASYHIYQGMESAIGIFFLGLVYAIAFVRLRSLWPLAIAHAVTDMVGLAMLAK